MRQCSKGAQCEGSLSTPLAPMSRSAAGLSTSPIWSRLGAALLLALLVGLLNLAVWTGLNQPLAVAEWPGKIHGLAFSAFQRDQSPFEQTYPSAEEIASDLGVLATSTTRIRSYGTLEYPALATKARERGLKLLQGVWLDRRADHNAAELAAVHRQVLGGERPKALVVGNEAILRGDLTPEQLGGYLRALKAGTGLPVTTAEPWHVWLKHPELADSVDFITIHLLPYWEGIAADVAVDAAFRHLQQVRDRFPGKPVVVGEVGWPSLGDRYLDAVASPANQARFIRDWIVRAEAEGIEYYLMEAFDQPWKVVTEGRPGAYWGIYDAERQPKFALTGPVIEDPEWFGRAGAATLLALPLMIWFAARFGRIDWRGRLGFLLFVQAAASLTVWSGAVPFRFYLEPLDAALLVLVLPAQLMMLGILLVLAFELVEVLFQRRWKRRFDVRPWTRGKPPKVSIHLPCHNEPPEMVILTLDSLARLDYPDFEVLVVDNNTARDDIWQPVRDHVATLGPRFRFWHLKPWPGFKAGALNHALEQTDPAAEVIAVIDSDYVVDSGWLRDFVGHFEDDSVAVVQAPQAHRAYEDNRFRRMTNFEYEGFFRIGMHHRNERNAIIQHGTMTMIRRSALEKVGGWGEWCICEDAELGLKLLMAGYETRYIDRVVGRGLTPADYGAFRSQRFRWAFGAMQIFRRHAWSLWNSPVADNGQRFHFLTGWFAWFADGLHFVFTVGALLWTIGMLYAKQLYALPLDLFVVPVLAFCLVKMAFGVISYRARVDCGWADAFGAAIASMSLSHVIARGVGKGLTTASHPFERTAKQRRLRRQPGALTIVREELLLLIVLVLAGVGSAWVLDGSKPEVQLWIAILIAQALPYAAAVAMALISARSQPRDGLNERNAAVRTDSATASEATTPAVARVGQSTH